MLYCVLVASHILTAPVLSLCGKVIVVESRRASLSDMLNNFKIEDVDDEEADDQAPPTQIPTKSKEQGNKGDNLKTRRVATSRPGKEEGFSASMSSIFSEEKGSSKTNRSKALNSSMLMFGAIAKSRHRKSSLGDSDKSLLVREGNNSDKKDHAASTISSIMNA